VLDNIVVECVANAFGFGANSWIVLIMNSLMTQGDLKQEDLASRLACQHVLRLLIKSDSPYTMLICSKFIIGVHYMVHHANLVIQIL
jgi:hypothetical protein